MMFQLKDSFKVYPKKLLYKALHPKDTIRNVLISLEKLDFNVIEKIERIDRLDKNCYFVYL